MPNIGLQQSYTKSIWMNTIMPMIKESQCQSMTKRKLQDADSLRDDLNDYKERLWCALGQPMNIEFIAAAKALRAENERLEGLVGDLSLAVEIFGFISQHIPKEQLQRINWRDPRFIEMIKQIIVFQDLER
jgi:hypothetical protein